MICSPIYFFVALALYCPQGYKVVEFRACGMEHTGQDAIEAFMKHDVMPYREECYIINAWEEVWIPPLFTFREEFKWE